MIRLVAVVSLRRLQRHCVSLSWSNPVCLRILQAAGIAPIPACFVRRPASLSSPGRLCMPKPSFPSSLVGNLQSAGCIVVILTGKAGGMSGSSRKREVAASKDRTETN